MLSDKVFTIGSHSIHYSNLQIALVASGFLFALAIFFWGYSRGSRAVSRKIVGTGEVPIYLGRIADALEGLQRTANSTSTRIFNTLESQHTASSEIVRHETVRQETPRQEAPRQEPSRVAESVPSRSADREAFVAYSIFGR